jgi:PAS domain S-box-containing protein
LVTSILLFYLVVLTWQRRRSPGSRCLSLQLAAAGIWSVIYAVQLGHTELEPLYFWARLRYPWIAVMPLFWYLFAASFSGGTKKGSPRTFLLLMIEPVLINLLIWSPYSQLFMQPIGMVQAGNVVFIDFSYGQLFWAHSLYSYGVMVVGSILLVRTLWDKRDIYRGQLGMLGIGILAPWISNALSIFELLPTPEFDVTPFSLLITGFAMLLGLYRYRLLNLLPIAMDTIFTHMREGVIVIDAEKRITDSNPSAGRLLGLNGNLAAGASFESSLPALIREIPLEHNGGHWRQEVDLQINGTRHYFDTHVTRLATDRGATQGWLITLHEITRLKQSEEKLRERARQIGILNEISFTANQQTDISGLMYKLAQELLTLSDADRCVILQVNGNSEKKVFGTADRISPEESGESTSGVTELEGYLADQVMETGSVGVIEDVKQRAGSSGNPVSDPANTMLGFPMVSGEETLGVILISYAKQMTPHQEMIGLYEHAAEQVALAAARAVLMENLEERVRERTAALEKANMGLEEEIAQRYFYEQELAKKAHDLELNQLDIIWRLANAGEFRDNETGNHVVRVGYYSWIIAQHLGLDENFCRMLFLTSPLHDIGKIGISDEILLKPGKFTDEDRVVMKEHCLIGANILLSNPAALFPIRINDQDPPVQVSEQHAVNPFLDMAASIALSHHEKWDGTGYPMELAGEDIPIEARIVTVADVFDALVSRRRYKPAFSLDQSLEIIREGAGKDYDPAVVNALLDALEDLLAVGEQFAD